jgi:hypothetical protein
MSEMGSYDPFGHLKHKLWSKEESKVKLTIWFLTTKSQESTRFPCVQVACHISLESSQWGIQLCFKPHLDQRSIEEVMGPQSYGTPNLRNFGILTWESQEKWHLGASLVARHRKYYKGEGVGFPQVWAMVSFMNPCVATLALGSRPRQGLTRVQDKREAREAHLIFPGV